MKSVRSNSACYDFVASHKVTILFRCIMDWMFYRQVSGEFVSAHITTIVCKQVTELFQSGLHCAGRRRSSGTEQRAHG